MASSKKKQYKVVKKGTTSRSSSPGHKPLKRPATRKIVRWNDDLDKKLLLSIQSACNDLGVKIPWAAVAKLMQNDISDGAIVQHLAKLRSRMVSAGMDVPPPLRRGGATAPSKLKAKAVEASRKTRIKVESSDDEYGDSKGARMHKKKSKEKKKRRNYKRKDVEAEDSDSSSASDTDHSMGSESRSSDKSDDSSEYVAVGAPFLEYPNDKGSTFVDDTANNASPQPTAARPTKLVKLRLSPTYLQQIERGDRIDGAQTSNAKGTDGANIDQQETGPFEDNVRMTQTIDVGAAPVKESATPQYPAWVAINGANQPMQAPQQAAAQLPANYDNLSSRINNIGYFAPPQSNAFPIPFAGQPQIIYNNMQTPSTFTQTEIATMVNQMGSQEDMTPWMDNGQGSAERHPEVRFMDDIGHDLYKDEPEFENTIDHEPENLFDMSNSHFDFMA